MIDQSLSFLRHGYDWAPSCRRGRSAVPIRWLGRRGALVGGPDGVRRFYDPRLMRHGAIPAPVRLVLFGPGALHGLDDEPHLRRKAMFVDQMTPAGVGGLAVLAEREWQRRVAGWTPGRPVRVFDEAVAVLARTVLPWAGISADAVGSEDRLEAYGHRLAAVVNGFGVPGPPWARAAAERVRLDRWAADLVRRTRSGELGTADSTALAAVARFSRDGRPLTARTAGVELQNFVRPTVAVAWFVAFGAVALHRHPRWRGPLAARDARVTAAVAHEVRRIHPFVPVLAARTREAQDVLGVPLPAGAPVVLDVHGTNHDPIDWPEPDRFRPERFLDTAPSGAWLDQDALVPQGGGEVRTGHRCPGEDTTLTMIRIALTALARADYEVPAQDLDWSMRRMPTRPRSGVIIMPGRGGG